jgi:hypothetical protein
VNPFTGTVFASWPLTTWSGQPWRESLSALPSIRKTGHTNRVPFALLLEVELDKKRLRRNGQGEVHAGSVLILHRRSKWYPTGAVEMRKSRTSPLSESEWPPISIFHAVHYLLVDDCDACR